MKRKRTNIWQRGTIWWIQYYVRGVRHRESSRSTKEIDAKNLLDQSIAEVRAGRPVGRRIEPTTLEELLAILVDDYRANARLSLRFQTSVPFSAPIAVRSILRPIELPRIEFTASKRAGPPPAPSTTSLRC